MRLTVKKVGVSMMMLATFFWGYMGISSRYLNHISLRTVDISFIRALSAAIMLTIYLFLERGQPLGYQSRASFSHVFMELYALPLVCPFIACL